MDRLFFTKKPSDTIADIIHDKNKQELCLKQRRCEKNNRKKRVLGKKNTKNRKNQHDERITLHTKKKNPSGGGIHIETSSLNFVLLSQKRQFVKYLVRFLFFG